MKGSKHFRTTHQDVALSSFGDGYFTHSLITSYLQPSMLLVKLR